MNEIQEVPPLPKSTPWRIIIPVGLAVILLCICLAVVGVLAYLGTQGTGPLSMLATATPTPLPTKTPTPTPTPGVVGNWDFFYAWECSDTSSGPILLIFNRDNTFKLTEGGATSFGTWYLAGEVVDFTFDDYPYAHYVGTLDNTFTHLEGTMDTTDNSSGCWYADLTP